MFRFKTIIILSILNVIYACDNQIKILDGTTNTVTCSDLGKHKNGCHDVEDMDLICFLKPLVVVVNEKCYSYTCRWKDPWEEDFNISIKIKPPYNNIHVELKPKYDVPILIEFVFFLSLFCILAACMPNILFFNNYNYDSTGSFSGYC